MKCTRSNLGINIGSRGMDIIQKGRPNQGHVPWIVRDQLRYKYRKPWHGYNTKRLSQWRACHEKACPKRAYHMNVRMCVPTPWALSLEQRLCAHNMEGPVPKRTCPMMTQRLYPDKNPRHGYCNKTVPRKGMSWEGLSQRGHVPRMFESSRAHSKQLHGITQGLSQ